MIDHSPLWSHYEGGNQKSNQDYDQLMARIEGKEKRRTLEWEWEKIRILRARELKRSLDLGLDSSLVKSNRLNR